MAITKLVPNTVPVIVMLSALMILNSSMVLPTLMDGSHQAPIRMLELANMDLAALRWISGKPTLSHLRSLLIHVPSMDNTNVKELSVVITIPVAMVDTMVSATRMVAI